MCSPLEWILLRGCNYYFFFAEGHVNAGVGLFSLPAAETSLSFYCGTLQHIMFSFILYTIMKFPGSYCFNLLSPEGRKAFSWTPLSDIIECKPRPTYHRDKEHTARRARSETQKKKKSDKNIYTLSARVEGRIGANFIIRSRRTSKTAHIKMFSAGIRGNIFYCRFAFINAMLRQTEIIAERSEPFARFNSPLNSGF